MRPLLTEGSDWQKRSVERARDSDEIEDMSLWDQGSGGECRRCAHAIFKLSVPTAMDRRTLSPRGLQKRCAMIRLVGDIRMATLAILSVRYVEASHASEG